MSKTSAYPDTLPSRYGNHHLDWRTTCCNRYRGDHEAGHHQGRCDSINDHLHDARSCAVFDHQYRFRFHWRATSYWRIPPPNNNHTIWERDGSACDKRNQRCNRSSRESFTGPENQQRFPSRLILRCPDQCPPRTAHALIRGSIVVLTSIHLQLLTLTSDIKRHRKKAKGVRTETKWEIDDFTIDDSPARHYR